MIKLRIGLFAAVNFLQLAIFIMPSSAMDNPKTEDYGYSIDWRLMAIDSDNGVQEKAALERVCTINGGNIININNVLINFDKITLHSLTDDQVKHLRDSRQKFKSQIHQGRLIIENDSALSGKIRGKELEIIFAERTYNGKNIIPIIDLLEVVLHQSVIIKTTKMTLISMINAIEHREDVKCVEYPERSKNKKKNLPIQSMDCARLIDLLPKSVRQVTIKIYDKKYSNDRIKRVKGLGERSISMKQYKGDYCVKSDTFYVYKSYGRDKVRFSYGGFVVPDKNRDVLEGVKGNGDLSRTNWTMYGEKNLVLDTEIETEFELETEKNDCACVLI